ncbi:MAG: alpha/beta hydrolase domain-containing protein [Pseudomonadota bacterium]
MKSRILITGTAAGDPYETRLVIRKPKDNSKFSGPG